MDYLKKMKVEGEKVSSVLCSFFTFIFFLFGTSTYGSAQLDPRYHTYEEMVAELDSLVTLYPHIMRVDSIGVSTQDTMTIWAVKISDNVDVEEDEPSILYHGVHHAEEVLGLEICMYMMHDLLSRYGFDSHVNWWVDNIEIWFVPLMNPEGHKVVTDGLDVTFRKNKRDNNNNGLFDFVPEIGGDIDGVDPNRNYDFNWDRGDTNWSSDYYRGPAPFSESENQAIRDLALEQRFAFAILYHSARTGTKEVIYYPWRWGDKHPPDFPIIMDTAERVAELVGRDDGTGNYTPWCSSLRAPFARDWFYVRTGTIPILIEVGSTIQPLGKDVDKICERNRVGAYYLLDRVLEGGITGCVTDSITGEPLEAKVDILEASGGILSPRKCDSQYGRYRRILLPGSYTVDVSKVGYRGKRLSDIIVNPSRPTVLDIALAPLQEWYFSGTVTDVLWDYPVEASLILKGQAIETVHSDPTTGEFSLSLCEGFYLIDLHADGYVAVVDSLDMAGDTTVEYGLFPAETLFTESFENGLSRWVVGGEVSHWNVSTSACHSSSHSLTDSPSGYYNNSNESWASMIQGLDLISFSSASLTFWHNDNLEPDFDSALVEVSTDGGANWECLGDGFRGNSNGWVHEVRSLQDYCGEAGDVRIRFRLLTDGSVDDDGWYIDDVQILAGEEAVGVEDPGDSFFPGAFFLGQNYPNPFNPTTTIHYAHTNEGRIPNHVTLKLYNVLGQEVRTLVNEDKEPGSFAVSWDGRDNSGRQVGSGIYFYRLQAGDFLRTKKMILLR